MSEKVKSRDAKKLREENEHLKRLLSDAQDWNWIDFDEMCATREGVEEAEATIPAMCDLAREIKEALSK